MESLRYLKDMKSGPTATIGKEQTMNVLIDTSDIMALTVLA